MSGVLDRMAQLALGALPTVEPLKAPRYALRSSEPRETGFPPETNLEGKSSASHLQAENRNAPSPLEPAKRGTASNRTNDPAFREDASVPQLASPPQQAQTPEKGSPAAFHTSIPEIAATLNAVFQHPENPVLPRNSVWRSIAYGEPEAQTARVEQQPLSTPAIPPRPSPVFEPDERATPHRPSASAAINVDAHSEFEPLPERNVQAIEPSPAPRRKWPRRQEQPSAPLEQRTEIHISIGSIELRAPRAESKAPAPAFRPLVSLDDFLRPKPEAGA